MKKTLDSTLWFEKLPESCPPKDSNDCNGLYYRIANGNPATDADFFSQRFLHPYKIFMNVDECVARSISVFDNLEETTKRLKLPKFRKAHVVSIALFEEDGKIKKTFGPSHYSWWRTKTFNPEKAKVLK